MTIAPGTNAAWTLDDNATAFAPAGGGQQIGLGHVAGKSYVFDTDPTASGATFSAVVGVTPSTLKLSAGNEQYLVQIVAAKAIATDGAGNITLSGATVVLGQPWGLTINGQQEVFGFSTLSAFDNTVYRYVQIQSVLQGTLPDLKMEAFLRPLSDLTPYEFSELVQLQVLTMQNIQNALACWLPWANGVVGGGVNNDGKYPIYDAFGHSVYLPCPAQMQFANVDPSTVANKVWNAGFETTGLSFEGRITESLLTIGYGGKHAGVADDDTYEYNAEALQAALDRGGLVRFPGPGKKIHIKGRVTYRPAWSSIDGNGSRLVADDLAMYTDPATMPNLVPNPVVITAGTIANYNIWRLNGTTLELVPVGPNLVPDPTLGDTSQYLQTDTGPNGETTFTAASTDPALGSYTTTFNGVETIHPVMVLSAPATVSGQSKFAEVCLVDAATHSNLLAFPITGGKRYAIGAMVRKMTGAATGIQISGYFSQDDGTGLGGGSSAGLTVNGASPDGHTFTIVDVPASATKGTIIIDFEKDPTSTGAALIAIDNWFIRDIDSACNICPNYVDAANNDGDYADVGIAISELISYPLETGVTPATYQAGARPMRYSVTFNVLELDAVGTQNYLTIALRQAVGVGSGSAVLPIDEAGQVTWEAAAPNDISALTGGYLTFQSSNGVKIDASSIVVKVVPENWILLAQADPADADFDQAVQSIRNLYIDGPNLDYAEGICFDTPATQPQASRGNLQNVQIFGCGIPTVYRTQAYLIFDIGVTKIGLDCAEKGIPSANAGEQINSLFPVYSGGRVVIDNCFERRIFGGSCDYPTQHQFVITTNTLETWGHHFEGDRPESPDEIPFTVGAGGAFRKHGGKIEFSGKNQNLAAIMPVMFRTNDKYSLVDLNYVEASNWQTASGYLADGPGRVRIRNTRGGDTKNITCFVKDDWRHNRFGAGGDCDGTAISIPMWVDGGDVRVGRHEVQYSGVVGSSFKAEMAADQSFDGAGCISITKNGAGGGTAAQVYIWFRVTDVGIPAIRFQFKCPNDLGGTGKQPIFIDAYCCQLLDTDVPGVYQLADGWQNGYFGEMDYEVDQAAGMTQWVQFQAGGSRSDKTIDFDGYTAEGDNAVLVIVNLTSMPSGFRLCIDKVEGALT